MQQTRGVTEFAIKNNGGLINLLKETPCSFWVCPKLVEKNEGKTPNLLQFSDDKPCDVIGYKPIYMRISPIKEELINGNIDTSYRHVEACTCLQKLSATSIDKKCCCQNQQNGHLTVYSNQQELQRQLIDC